MRMMDRIRKLFKSRLFIFLFSVALTLISLFIFNDILFATNNHFESILIPAITLILGPYGILGYGITIFAYYYSANPEFLSVALMHLIFTLISSLIIWKLWYSTMNKYGYEVPNTGSLYNLIKLTFVYVIFNITAITSMNILVHEKVLEINLTLSTMTFLPFHFIIIILAVYIFYRFKIPFYTPRVQFKPILSKKAYSIMPALIAILGLAYVGIVNFYPFELDIIIGSIFMILVIIYLLKPYDEEVFEIKDNADLNIFSKANISIFLIVLILLIILIVLPYFIGRGQIILTTDVVNKIFNTFQKLFLLILIPIIIYLYFLEEKLTKPLNRFSQTLTKKINDREDYLKLEKELRSIDTQNEIKILIDTLLDMEIDYIEYSENLMKLTSQKERLETELKLARDIQESLIPKDFEEFENKFDNEFEIAASMETAREVGGDFYDYFQIDEDNIGFVIGDVSGKGISTSLITVKAMTLIQDYSRHFKDLSESSYKLNNALFEENAEKNYVSCWIGKLNVRTKELTFVNAGHNQPLICLNEGDFEYMANEIDSKLAISKDQTFKSHTMQLNKGDTIFLYTNEAIEAENENHETYGEERLREILSSHKNDDLSSILDWIKEDIARFQINSEQEEDRAMFIFRLNEDADNPDDSDTVDSETKPTEEIVDSETKSTGRIKSIRLDPELINLNAINEFIHDIVEDFQVDMIVEEMFVNIVEYSNCEYIIVNAQYEDNLLTLEFIDNGFEFNPLLKEDQEKPNSIEEAQIGGLGIFLTKEMADEIEYNYQNDENHLKIMKKIE